MRTDFKLHILTPVKDSIGLSLKTIATVMESALPDGSVYTVYNDRSTPENREILTEAAGRYGFELVNLEDITDNPSPNYLTVLRMSRKRALAEGAHVCIVESDVLVKDDTIRRLRDKASQLPSCGMAAAVTVDESGEVNYPYSKMGLPFKKGGDISTRKHLSFCCTLLTNDLLRAVDFDTFDDTKNWFDVTVSRESVRCGLSNYVCSDLKVVHQPHGSRPWKLMKYSNPIKYYWQKLTKKRDRI